MKFNEWFDNSKVIDDEGNPLPVYHGAVPAGAREFEAPAFFTSSRKDGRSYPIDDPDGEEVIEARLCLKRPFITGHSREEDTAFIELARRAGVIVIETETEHGRQVEVPDIARNTPFDGTNLNHIVYLPAVREQLLKEGYDGVITSDTVTNYEVDAYIALLPEQIQIVRAFTLEKENKNEPGNPGL